MENRFQLWACGGGRQSAGIAALMQLGKLPRPDAACMVKIEWEHHAVWPYVDTYIRPALARLGVPFTVIPRRDFARREFFGGAEGATPLLPLYTDQSGEAAKLTEWCSSYWKREVTESWCRSQESLVARGIDVWLGISWDERRRRSAPRRRWIQPRYPLLDLRPTHLSALLAAVEEVGWPPPPRSRCFHCPNQSDAEWAELSPAEWEAACDRDDWLRLTDPHAYLHKSMIPLRQVVLDRTPAAADLFSGGCTSGMCY